MGENYYSTGRGGAGNMASVKNSPKYQEVVNSPGDEIPHLTQTTFTTGRGGMGNMMRNVDREQARRAQDVDDGGQTEVSPVFSNKSIGRGGFGNLQAVHSAESAKKRAESNSHQHKDDPNTDEDSKGSLFKKVRNIFK